MIKEYFAYAERSTGRYLNTVNNKQYRALKTPQILDLETEYIRKTSFYSPILIYGVKTDAVANCGSYQ